MAIADSTGPPARATPRNTTPAAAVAISPGSQKAAGPVSRNPPRSAYSTHGTSSGAATATPASALRAAHHRCPVPTSAHRPTATTGTSPIGGRNEAETPVNRPTAASLPTRSHRPVGQGRSADDTAHGRAATAGIPTHRPESPSATMAGPAMSTVPARYPGTDPIPHTRSKRPIPNAPATKEATVRNAVARPALPSSTSWTTATAPTDGKRTSGDPSPAGFHPPA